VAATDKIRVRFKQRTAFEGNQIALAGAVHEIPEGQFHESFHERVDADTPLDDPKPWDHPDHPNRRSSDA
jgi:hypothetical protein